MSACSPLPSLKIDVRSLPSGTTTLSAIIWRFDGPTMPEKLVISDDQPNLTFDLSGSSVTGYSFGLNLPNRDTAYVVSVGAFTTMSNLYCLRSIALTGEAGGFGILDTLTAEMGPDLRAAGDTDTSTCIADVGNPQTPIIATVTATQTRGDPSSPDVIALSVGGWNFDPQLSQQSVLVGQGPQGSSVDTLPKIALMGNLMVPNATQIIYPFSSSDWTGITQKNAPFVHVKVVNHKNPTDATSTSYSSNEFVQYFGGT